MVDAIIAQFGEHVGRQVTADEVGAALKALRMQRGEDVPPEEALAFLVDYLQNPPA